MFVYVGCYTAADRGGTGEGIVRFRLEDGVWSDPVLAAPCPNPSFLATDATERLLFSVHGGNEYDEVSVFAIDPESGRLDYLNRQSTGGTNPVHVDVHESGSMIVVANYTGGTVASLPIAADGSLLPLVTSLKVEGTAGPNAKEQTSSHPHHFPLDPSGRFALLPDKGFDQIVVYRLNPDDASMSLHQTVPAATGAGPRHIAFHPDQPLAYVINELDCTVTIYRWIDELLKPISSVSALPDGVALGANTGAEIEVSRDGRFVYASIREHNSIVVYEVDQENLRPLQWVSTQGETPRFFALDPSGAYLYACNQDSHTIVVFAVDGQSGMLKPTGHVVETPSPVSLVFVNETNPR